MSTTAPTTFDAYHVWLGIPPNEQPPNYYRLLGLSPFESDPNVIASAADRQLAHLRTFQLGKQSAHSQRLLNEVAAAEVCLLKPAKKAAYDAQLRRELTPQPAPTTPIPVAQPLFEQTWQLSSQVASHDAHFAPTFSPQYVKVSTARVRRHSWFGPTVLAVMVAVFVIAGLLAWKSTRSTAVAEANSTVAMSRPNAPAVPSRSPQPSLTKSLATDEPPVSPRDTPIAESTPPPETVSHISVPVDADSQIETLHSATTREVESDTTPSEQPPVFQPIPTKNSLPVNPTPQINILVGSATTDASSSKRMPAPTSAVQQAIRGQLTAILGNDQVKSPSDSLRLARQCLEAAQSLTDEQAEEYFVLLSRAAELAATGGDAALAMRTLETLHRRFEVNLTASKTDALVKLADSATTLERMQPLVPEANRTIEQALQEEDFSRALQIAEALLGACQRSHGKDFRKQVVEQRNLVMGIYKKQQDLRAAEMALAANGEDQSANLVLGQWYCFTKQDWQRGLPYLAKGNDPGLRDLAVRERAFVPSSAEERIELGDAWWTVAQDRVEAERDAILLYAGEWYQRAQAEGVSGIHRIKVEKRMEELVPVRQRQAARQSQVRLSTNNLWSEDTP